MFDRSFEEPATVPKTKISGAKIYFCESCQGVLQPRPPQNRSKGLEYTCPHCNISVDIDDNRVYAHVLKRNQNSSVLSSNLISEDPTLKRKIRHCENCEREVEVVLFLAPTLAGEETMKQMMECTICRHQVVLE